MKHVDEFTKAEAFLEAITDSQAHVSRLESKNIIFKLSQVPVNVLQNGFFNSIEFAKTIWRAIKGQKNTEEKLFDQNTNQNTTEVDLLEPFVNLTPEELLGKLLSSDALSVFHFNSLADEYHLGVASCESKSNHQAKIFKAQASLINLALQDLDQVKDILLGLRGPFSQEDLEDLDDSGKEVESNIFRVTKNGKIVEVVFNAASLLQKLQTLEEFRNSTPIISQITGSQGEYSLDFDRLQTFIGEKVAPLIFKLEANSLQPIACFPQKSVNNFIENSLLVDISLDNSLSMSTKDESTYTRWEICKQKFKLILEEIRQLNSSWTLNLTIFHDQRITKTFDSKNSSTIEIYDFIDSMNTKGNTDLYGTMLEQITNTSKFNYTHCFVLCFTDGEDNQKKATPEEIVSSTNSVINQIDNIQVFFMELGSSNSEFSQKLSKNGCVAIQLNDMSQMSELQPYISSINKKTHVITFLEEAAQNHIRSKIVASEGGLVIGNPIAKEDFVIVAGERYNITPPTRKLCDLGSADPQDHTVGFSGELVDSEFSG